MRKTTDVLELLVLLRSITMQ